MVLAGSLLYYPETMIRKQLFKLEREKILLEFELATSIDGKVCSCKMCLIIYAL